MLFVLPLWFNVTVAALVILFAWARGRAPERIYATWIALVLLHDRLDPHVFGQDLGHQLLVDLAEALLLIVLALRYDRYWVLGAASAALMGAATTGFEAVLHLHGWAYGTAMLTWAYIAEALLTIGTWNSWRRRRAALAAAVPA